MLVNYLYGIFLYNLAPYSRHTNWRSPDAKSRSPNGNAHTFIKTLALYYPSGTLVLQRILKSLIRPVESCRLSLLAEPGDKEKRFVVKSVLTRTVGMRKQP